MSEKAPRDDEGALINPLPDTIPQLRAAARRTGGYSRSVPHAEVREAVVHIDEQAKEIAALRAQLAEVQDERDAFRADRDEWRTENDALRRETAQRCAEIARKGPVGGTTIAAAIKQEFGL